MATVENKSNEKSIRAKVGSVVARSEKFVGRFLALPLNAVIYTVTLSWRNKSWGKRGSDCANGLKHLVSSKDDDSFFDRLGISLVKPFTYLAKPSNLSKPSWGWLWHDIKNGGRYIIGMPLEEYDQVEKDIQKGITQASKNLGVEVELVDYEEGKMIFKASGVLGDASRLTPVQLDKIKKDLPNVTVDKGRNKVTIEVDVNAIINDIKADPANKGKSEKEIRKLATARIEQEVDSTLKKFGEISGGEFQYHTDKKLLKAIGEALYRGSVSKEKPVKKSAEAVTQLNEKPVQDLDPSKTETLRSGDKQDLDEQDLSETFRRLFDDGSLPKIAEPLVNSGKRKRGSSEMESSEVDEQLYKKQKVDSQGVSMPESTGGTSEAFNVNKSSEAARKAVKKAEAERQEQSRNAAIDSKGLGQIFQPGRQLTGGCGTQTAKLQEKQGQAVGPQGSKGFNKGGV